MASAGKAKQLVDQFGYPRRLSGEEDGTAFEFWLARIKATFLVAIRIDGDDRDLRPTKFLDQASARCLVFHQDSRMRILLLQADSSLFKFWEIEATANEINQIVLVSLDQPDRSNRIIGNTGRLHGGVPADDPTIDGAVE